MLRNLQVQNLKSGKSHYPMDLQGFPNAPITDVHLENCTFDNTARPSIVKNVRGFTLHNVRVNGQLLSETEALSINMKCLRHFGQDRVSTRDEINDYARAHLDADGFG